MSHISRKLKFSIVLTFIILAIWLDFPIGIRFENPKYNYFFITASLFILYFLVVVNLRWLRSYSVLIDNAVVLLLITMLLIPVSYCAVIETSNIDKNGIDVSFENIQEVDYSDYKIRLYRTNGGATTAFGLVVRKEKEIFLGLKTVEEMFSEYEASEGMLEIDQDGVLKLHIGQYSKAKPSHTVALLGAQ